MHRLEDLGGLVARVLATRRATIALAEPLEVEDWVAQSMPDASPVKWHLAHTTWFFERFVLSTLGIPPTAESNDFMFNSYYEAVGKRVARDKRGLMTRPTVKEVLAYRAAIDQRLADLQGSPRLAEIAGALELGRNHEEQHQELLLTDVKHLLAENPLAPAYRKERPAAKAAKATGAPALTFHPFDGGVAEIGHRGTAFAFDNEGPRHKVYLAPFAIASRMVTAGEYKAFIADGGYRRPELWLSEGWAWVNGERTAPLYWDGERHFTLDGLQSIHDAEPVTHVTYYEADAFARWAGARLPTEAEWEIAAARSSPGRFVEDGALHPSVATANASGPVSGDRPLTQMLGDAWEWTQSAYAAYPGFQPLEGAFGEYNGKFMVSQMVLRGGSCATPRAHARITYRNFFPPSAAWQFTGIRLAKDLA